MAYSSCRVNKGFYLIRRILKVNFQSSSDKLKHPSIRDDSYYSINSCSYKISVENVSVLSERLYVLDVDFGEDVVGGAHFHLEDDVGGFVFLGEESFDAFEGALGDFDFLAQFQFVGGDGDGSGGVGEDLL